MFVFFFVDHIVIVSPLFQIIKDTHWTFAKIGQKFSPWAPIRHHFVYFWMMSVQNNPRLSRSLLKINNKDRARRLKEDCSKLYQTCIKLAKQLLIETTLYLVMINFLIFLPNFKCLDFAMICQFASSNITVKTNIFGTCFQQSAKGKMTAWDVQ